jgi:hypothetical protein
MIKFPSNDDPACAQCAVHTLRNTIYLAVFIGGAAARLGLLFTDDFTGGDDLTPL